MNIAIADEHDRQRGLEHEDEAVAEEEAHRLQVDRRARHQLAGLLAVEERQLEVLEVLVHAAAQVALDAERDAAGDQPADVGERRGAGCRRPARPPPSSSSPRLVALVDLVDRACR